MREPKFNSAFAPMMYAFWKKREQEGYNNKNQIYYLEEFDRLIMQSKLGSTIINSELIELWDSYKPYLSNRTKISRHNIIRSFCEYLYEHDHCSFVPDRSKVKNTSAFFPYIFTEEEISRLIGAADNLPQRKNAPYREIVLPAIYRVLYCCGLRVNEALRLNPYYVAPVTTPSGSTGNGSSGQDTPQTTVPSAPASDSATQPDSTESTSSIPAGAFTPEGTGTVQDNVTSADDKQFYTITTEAGNVFYLIIDGKRDSNNVYFLNGVTESDLLALAEKDGSSTTNSIPEVFTCTCSVKCEAGRVHTSCQVCKNDLNGCTAKAAEVTPEPTEPEKPSSGGSNAAMLILAAVALLGVGGVGYYVKIVKPKREATDEDDDFEDDGYGEGFDPTAEYGTTEYLPDEEDETGDGE